MHRLSLIIIALILFGCSTEEPRTVAELSWHGPDGVAIEPVNDARSVAGKKMYD